MTIVGQPFLKIAIPPIPDFSDVSSAVVLRMNFDPVGAKMVDLGVRKKWMVLGEGIEITPEVKARKFCEEFRAKVEDYTVFAFGSETGDVRYHVCKKVAKLFLEALQSNRNIFVPIQDLQRTLEGLMEKNIITEPEKSSFSQMIYSGLLQEDYVAEIEQTRDKDKALACASESARKGNWMQAIHWLVVARKFLQKNYFQDDVRLQNFFDLASFWSGIKKISGIGCEMFFPGMEELVETAAVSSTIKEIVIKGSDSEIKEVCGGIGRFLQRSKAIERLSISGYVARSFAAENFTKIIQGLGVNSSLKELSLIDYAISDDFVKEIVDALLLNKDSKVETLTLILPEMKDGGALSLFRLLDAKPRLRIFYKDWLRVSRELLIERQDLHALDQEPIPASRM